jgi:hypothetical protein
VLEKRCLFREWLIGRVLVNELDILSTAEMNLYIW